MGAEKYYLAVDIGASSGRHILFHMESGKIVMEEIYRFHNGNDITVCEDGRKHRVWDMERLFNEVVNGLIECKKQGKIPYSMGIDTWAVDYVLLDENDKRIGPCYAYRDDRTSGMDEEVYKVISEEKLYARTGIQKQIFNTIYQLMADAKNEPDRLKKAESFLMVPDYLDFLLTGQKFQEYTNATTTGLVSPETCEWDRELIELLGFPSKLFTKLSMPGTEVGELSAEIQKKVGFNTKVILCATHDTGSAVMSIPYTEEEDTESDTLYISSGTWSLMGTELKRASSGEKEYKANFTNEGGYDKRFRFLKNIMGLWMIQEAQREFVKNDPDGVWDFGSMCDRAMKQDIKSTVDCNSDVFLAPESMAAAVQSECRNSGEQVPETPDEIASVIYNSLAECYASTVKEIENITGKHYSVIHIVGGGSKAEGLNILTARASGKKVIAGPAEATAIGNAGAQMIKDHVFSDLTAFRRCIYSSFGVKTF